MDNMELFLRTNDLNDPDNIDALLDLAALVRELMEERRYEDIGRILRHCVERDCREALSWCLNVIEEAFQKAGPGAEPFACVLGSAIANFDALTELLQVDFRVCTNGIEPIRDHHGEVESFFNILSYETAYPHIRFVSTENFDTQDRDYVLYQLAFSRN